MLETGEFCFLNVARPSAGTIPWSLPGMSKLWLYNFNYFDFLNADFRAPQHRLHLRRALEMARDWCARNVTGEEVGWEPFPLSLRIVNWLKFLLRNAEPAEALGEGKTLEALLASLRVQALALEARLETHLLANHLLKNIKALMFAGALLDAPESARWLSKGEKLLQRELAEQILPDGGHIERSPMYHAEVLEDLLDLQALTAACGRSGNGVQKLPPHVTRMANFLRCVIHPDGEIPLLNDSAFGVAPPTPEVLQRAGLVVAGLPNNGQEVFPPALAPLPTRRGESGAGCASSPMPAVEAPLNCRPKVTVLRESGYAAVRDPSCESCLIFDCGPLGPDYQPGHGHCDVLSYELSLHGRRVVVDTGVSTYEPCAERHYERSTSAHNTVRVDGEEQAEIWASFRVGRRPKVGALEGGVVRDFCFVRGAHYAYQSRGVVHSRTIVLTPRRCWVVIDLLSGKGQHEVESFIHFHPAVSLESSNRAAGVDFGRAWVMSFGDYRYCLATFGGGDLQQQQTWYAPEFGLRQRRTTLHWRWGGELPATLVYALSPAGERPPDIRPSPGQKAVEIDTVFIPWS